MIARLAIAAEALDDLAQLGTRGAKREHERLLQLVREHGALVFADGEAATQFLRRVREGSSPLPAGVGKRWNELVIDFHKANRMRVAEPSLAPPLRSARFEEVSPAWAQAVDVAVIDGDTATALGVPDEDGLLTDSATGFEVALADSIGQTNHLTRIKRLRDKGFHPEGALREEFWGEVVFPIWDVSSRATVLDRYLFKQIWRGARNEQLQWLIQRLAGATVRRPRRITLIGEALADCQVNLDQVLQVVDEACRGGVVDKVTVKLVPPPGRGQTPHLPHERHIRFDNAAVFLGPGFDRLSRSKVTAHDGLHWDYRWSPEALTALRAVEDRAARASGVQDATWTP